MANPGFEFVSFFLHAVPSLAKFAAWAALAVVVRQHFPSGGRSGTTASVGAAVLAIVASFEFAYYIETYLHGLFPFLKGKPIQSSGWAGPLFDFGHVASAAGIALLVTALARAWRSRPPAVSE